MGPWSAGRLFVSQRPTGPPPYFISDFSEPLNQPLLMLEVFILYFSCQEHENPPIHYMDQSFLVAFSVAFPGERL